MSAVIQPPSSGTAPSRKPQDLNPLSFMLELEDAFNRSLSVIQPLGQEPVPLTDAADRVLAAPVVSPVDLPRFDNSAMDGYAVRAADLAGAGAETPLPLQLRGKVAAGGVPVDPVAAGTCVRLF